MGLRGVARTSQALGLPMVLEAVDSGGVEGRRAPSDAYVTRNAPPLPPHITAEFAKMTGEAFLKGDPFAIDAIRDSAQALIVEGVERVKGKLHRPDHD